MIGRHLITGTNLCDVNRLYLPCARWPEGGKMTVGFNLLQIGDAVELKGPLGSFVWQGRGIASYRGKERRLKEVGMVCGGSGACTLMNSLMCHY